MADRLVQLADKGAGVGHSHALSSGGGVAGKARKSRQLEAWSALASGARASSMV
jgi:hypothetical protein